MALHGALVSDAPQPPGYLVRIGEARMTIAYLDELGPELAVHAVLIQSLTRGHSYSFTLSGAGGTPALEGRATVALLA